jgi:ATP-binding protein involved in chromosome partitioning
MEPSSRQIDAALDQVIDPELGRSLLELGMIRSVEVDQGVVFVELALTSPSCPCRDEFIAQIRERVGAVAGVGEVDVQLVWPDA